MAGRRRAGAVWVAAAAVVVRVGVLGVRVGVYRAYGRGEEMRVLDLDVRVVGGTDG